MSADLWVSLLTKEKHRPADIEAAIERMSLNEEHASLKSLREIAESIRNQRRTAEETAAREAEQRELQRKRDNQTPEERARNRLAMTICKEYLTGELSRGVPFEAELERRMAAWVAEQTKEVA